VVTRTGGTFAVAVDGQTRHVDAARIDAHTLSLVVDSVCPENSSVRRSGHEVSIVPDRVGGQLAVYVGAVPVAVALNGRRHWGGKDDGRVSGSGPQRLVAPMAGKIVRVLVNAGDIVGSRQPIVVVEAMKMENELRASREGTVAEVHVREGMSVDAGALLIVIQ
jgi:biotin carboxyl carrier protein